MNSGRPRRKVRTYKDGPVVDRRLPTEGVEYELALHSIFKWGHLATLVENCGYALQAYHSSQKVCRAYLADIHFTLVHGQILHMLCLLRHRGPRPSQQL